MAGTEVARPAAAAAAACAHCGLAVPAGRLVAGATTQFCCDGCRTVHAVIHEHGLERYYVLRARDGGEAAPARPTTRSYDELDDAGLLRRSARPVPGGGLVVDLFLEGVHCAACVWLVERLPRVAPGVDELRLDVARSRVTVWWDPAVTRLSAVARALDRLGYPVHPVRGLRQEEVRRREDRAMLARIGLAGAVAANVMAIAFALYGGLLHGIEPEYATFFRWASLLITVPALVWGGGVFFRGAWAALRLRTLHMDLPISLGLLAGFGHGVLVTVRGSGEVYFDSITTLIFLLLVGRYLQRRQQRAAAESAELLASLAPSAAHLLGEDGGVRDVPLEALVRGQRVEVRAGELIPADGLVAAGRSTLDLSLLTGESRPVGAKPGDVVHAGTVNLSSRLEVTVERTGEETRVGRLLQLVEEHGRRRAPIVQLADRIAGAFVAVILALAVVTLLVWLRLDPERAVDHTVALLIVTCPCALGLATPLALSAAIGQAARAGFLVKGADAVERLTCPGRMWLDKTGTLTAGRATLACWDGDDGARPLVAAVEARSAHPLARAFVAGLGVAPAPGPVAIVESHGGGIEGTVGARRVVIGSPAFVAARVAAPAGALEEALARTVAAAATPVLVAVDGRVVAVAGFADALRDDAAEAVRRLRARGWRVGLLSGDHQSVVDAAGRALGLPREDCRGGVPPEGKLRTVLDDLRRGPVVMVGDGFNDAAALAAATVGIGMHGGAEAALTAADVFVTRPGVARVADLLEGAARAMRVVWRNLVVSLAYNVVGVALAMGGLLNPLVAAVLMPLSSLTVILGSYRARTFTGARRSRAWR
jgi:Cu2+-exporting ATPase